MIKFENYIIIIQVSDGSGNAPVYGGLLKGFRSIVNKNGWTGLYQVRKYSGFIFESIYCRIPWTALASHSNLCSTAHKVFYSTRNVQNKL